jgi:hypothetical protein
MLIAKLLLYTACAVINSLAHQKVFPRGTVFNTSLEQEAAVRDWLCKAGLSIEAARLRFVFYKGRYDKVTYSTY